MKVKVVLFDCGGVVLRPQENGTYQRWEERLGLETGALTKVLWESDAYRQAEIGKLSEADFWAKMAPVFPQLSEGDLRQLRIDLWDVFTPNAHVLDWAKRLRRTCRVAILSNATSDLEDLLRDHFQVAQHFEAIFNSARLGVAKPDLAIYQKVLQRLGVVPGDALLIDDRPENVAAAARLGIHVLWYVGDAELDRQLAVYFQGG